MKRSRAPGVRNSRRAWRSVIYHIFRIDARLRQVAFAARGYARLVFASGGQNFATSRCLGGRKGGRSEMPRSLGGYRTAANLFPKSGHRGQKLPCF